MGNTDKFEMMANQYDTPERMKVAKISSDAIRHLLVNTQNKTAIDFGCGTGLVGLDLLHEFKSVLFLDTSQNMLNRVEQKINIDTLQNANTLCFDFEKDNLLDLQVDYIFMAQVLLHIDDYQSVLQKLYDVLNKDGHLIIVDFNKNNEINSDLVHNGFDQGELTDVMTKIGYNCIQSKNIYSGSNIFMGKDATMFILDVQK